MALSSFQKASKQEELHSRACRHRTATLGTQVPVHLSSLIIHSKTVHRWMW